MNINNKKKGFTLVELLIVIGILAVLGTTAVVILNPAQLLAQARDGQRISDMNSVVGAISFYMASVTPIDLDNGTGACGAQWWASITEVAAANQPFGTPATKVISQTLADPTLVTNAGWVPIDFTSISEGSPLSALPLDPTNDATNALDAATDPGLFYAYQCDDTEKTFEINANLESDKFSNNGGSDEESEDGGNNPDIYEVGNDPGLNL